MTIILHNIGIPPPAGCNCRGWSGTAHSIVLGLNNLAPDIVEAIVAGTEPDGLSIAQIMKNIPEDWNELRKLYGFPER